MAASFTQDLEAARQALDASRRDLLDVLASLRDDDLDRARRGGWTVRRVLQHVIESEWLYARLIAHLREIPAAPGETRGGPPASVEEARERLDAARAALLAALDGVDEASFYRLRAVGHEEYSILSALENAAQHDREHAHQIREILASA